MKQRCQRASHKQAHIKWLGDVRRCLGGSSCQWRSAHADSRVLQCGTDGIERKVLERWHIGRCRIRGIGGIAGTNGVGVQYEPLHMRQQVLVVAPSHSQRMHGNVYSKQRMWASRGCASHSASVGGAYQVALVASEAIDAAAPSQYSSCLVRSSCCCYCSWPTQLTTMMRSHHHRARMPVAT
jgi:hypothetical protein